MPLNFLQTLRDCRKIIQRRDMRPGITEQDSLGLRRDLAARVMPAPIACKTIQREITGLVPAKTANDGARNIVLHSRRNFPHQTTQRFQVAALPGVALDGFPKGFPLVHLAADNFRDASCCIGPGSGLPAFSN